MKTELKEIIEEQQSKKFTIDPEDTVHAAVLRLEFRSNKSFQVNLDALIMGSELALKASIHRALKKSPTLYRAMLWAVSDYIAENMEQEKNETKNPGQSQGS